MIETILLTQRLDVNTDAAVPIFTNEGLRIPPLNLPPFSMRSVKGIQLPGGKTQLAPDARERDTRANLKEEIIHLSDKKAHRLGEYVSRIVVNGEPLFRNCISFMGFIHEGIPDLANVQSPVYFDADVDKFVPVPVDGLQAGESYAISTPSRRNPGTQYLVHGAIGTNNYHENLAVWGDNGTLAVGNNYDMLKVYQGTNIYRIDGKFTVTTAM